MSTAGLMGPGMSYLLAMITTGASVSISGWFSTACSSSAASEIRAESELSITNSTPAIVNENKTFNHQGITIPGKGLSISLKYVNFRGLPR